METKWEHHDGMLMGHMDRIEQNPIHDKVDVIDIPTTINSKQLLL